MTKWMKWVLGLLFLLTPFLSVSCTGKDKQVFFVKIICDRQEMVQGDSCLLSVVAYAEHPFLMKECPEPLKAKHARLRKINIGRQPIQRVREHQRIYYACVVQQYVLHSDQPGRVTVPEQTFKAELHIQDGEVDPLDVFLGRPVPVRKVMQKGENEVFEFKVVEKPMRTMQEMRESGIEVL